MDPGGRDPSPSRHADQFRDRPDAHLGHESPPMDLHRLLRHSEIHSDLLVETAGDDMPKHLPFATGQGSEAMFDRRAPDPRSAGLTILSKAQASTTTICSPKWTTPR